MSHEVKNFQPGDRVRHKLCPSWRGTFVRYSARSVFLEGERGWKRKIWWKGFNPFLPDQEDWTWEDCMEADGEIQGDVDIRGQDGDGHIRGQK